MAPGILAGLRVVELSAFVAAPLCGATLASLGAEVVRIDPQGGGIDFKRWPLHNGRSLYWEGLNQGKRSLTLDLRSERGRELATRIITAPGEGSGIVVTNLGASGWNSYETLSAIRKDLIMVVITGSHDGTTAVDYTVNAAVGFPWVTGPEGHDAPVNHVLPAWDALTGYQAALAVLAAERHRRLTGEGQLVTIALADVGLAVAGHLGLLAEAALVEEPRGRYGNDLLGTYAKDFPTSDGRRVIVLALTARQWRSLTDTTGLTEQFAELEKKHGYDFGEEGDRWRARRQISALLAPWFAARKLSEVRKALDAGGVLWGPYQTFKQLLAEDPRASAANPLLAEVDHPGIGRYLTNTSPLRFGAVEPVPPRPAPELGADTEALLGQLQ